ncbi:hypothetical protein Tco_0647851 [Tanacetum coccineum]
MYQDLASLLILSLACTNALGVATPRVNLEGTGGIQGDQVQSFNDRPHSDGNTSKRAEGGLNLQAAEILKLKTRIKKLEKKCKPSISHHKAWLRSVSRLSRTKKLVHGMNYMKIEEIVNERRQSNETEELNLDVDTKVITKDKGSGEKGGSTVSTARPEVDTARPNIDTARPEVHNANAPVSTAGVTISTVDLEVSVVEPRTPPTTTSIFDDEDITMAQTLIKMKEEKAKEKGVAFEDVEDSSRPIRSITTLKPLPSIDPKDKGKGILVEEEPVKIKRKDQGIDQIERDEELAHKLHEKELAEIAIIQEEKAAQEEASRVAIMEMFDEFLAETIVAQRKFRAAQRDAEIRSRPPTKSQLRNLMMTYLKNMGSYKHSQLKVKTFKEIQAMYERQKKRIDDFKPMDSDDAVKDSKKAAGEDISKKEEVLKEPDSTKIESMNKEDEGERVLDVSKKRKGDKERIIDYEVLEKRFPIINWESKFYHYDRHGAEGFGVIKPGDAENCGVYTLTLEDGTEIHLLAKKKYPLTKETLERMMSLKLIAGSASDGAYDLLKFIQKQINEARSHDGGTKDL